MRCGCVEVSHVLIRASCKDKKSNEEETACIENPVRLFRWSLRELRQRVKSCLVGEF